MGYFPFFYDFDFLFETNGTIVEIDIGFNWGDRDNK